MDGEPTYTVFIRLPFPRGDFVDPPAVKWDASKDEALWKILSGVAKTEIDWNDLLVAAKFEVTVDFLFQQVTYLTDRHHSQVRAQMRKVQAAARSSATPSPGPGAESSTATVKTPSGQGHTRAPSSLSMRKDAALVRNDASLPSTPRTATGPVLGPSRPQIPRDAASGSAPQTGAPGSTAGSLRLKTAARPPSPRQPGRHRLANIPISNPSTPLAETSPTIPNAEPVSPTSPSGSSSERDSDESSSPAQSRIIKRPPRFQQQLHRDDGPRSSFLDDMDEDEAEPAFLPFRGKTSSNVSEGSRHGGSAQYSDPSATLRGDPRDFAANAERRLQNATGAIEPSFSRGKGKEQERVLQQSQTSDSSASSAAAFPPTRFGNRRKPSTPLSPRRTAELKGKGLSREGSDGAPSMGSSFSDLDDASVTQSALEEALASKMQAGAGSTIGSTITNVFRSRYMPK